MTQVLRPRGYATAPGRFREGDVRVTRRRALFIIDTGPLMVLAVLGTVWDGTRRWRRGAAPEL